jgi:hypothetical protein
LKSELGVGQWDYVNNKAGGFYGYFGKRIRLDDGAMYLQVEMSARENKLCIKIDVKDDDRTKHFGHRWSKRCVADSRKQGLFVLKPGRIRVGQTMTVAKNEKPFPVTDEHGYVDITATVELLRSWQSFIELYEEAVALRGFIPPKISVHSANASAAQKMRAGIVSIEKLAL